MKNYIILLLVTLLYDISTSKIQASNNLRCLIGMHFRESSPVPDSLSQRTELTGQSIRIKPIPSLSDLNNARGLILTCMERQKKAGQPVSDYQLKRLKTLETGISNMSQALPIHIKQKSLTRYCCGFSLLSKKR